MVRSLDRVGLCGDGSIKVLLGHLFADQLEYLTDRVVDGHVNLVLVNAVCLDIQFQAGCFLGYLIEEVNGKTFLRFFYSLHF